MRVIPSGARLDIPTNAIGPKIDVDTNGAAAQADHIRASRFSP